MHGQCTDPDSSFLVVFSWRILTRQRLSQSLKHESLGLSYKSLPQPQMDKHQMLKIHCQMLHCKRRQIVNLLWVPHPGCQDVLSVLLTQTWEAKLKQAT